MLEDVGDVGAIWKTLANVGHVFCFVIFDCNDFMIFYGIV